VTSRAQPRAVLVVQLAFRQTLAAPRSHARTHSTRSRRRRILRRTFLSRVCLGVEPVESFSSPKPGTKNSAFERNVRLNTGGCSRYKTSPRCRARSASVGTIHSRQAGTGWPHACIRRSAVADWRWRALYGAVLCCSAGVRLLAWFELAECVCLSACLLACFARPSLRMHAAPDHRSARLCSLSTANEHLTLETSAPCFRQNRGYNPDTQNRLM